MSGSPKASLLQEEEDRRPPSTSVSSQVQLQETNSGGREGVSMKLLGPPLRSLLQEPDNSIPPREEPESPKGKEKEYSFESPKRDTSLSSSPLRSPIHPAENTTASENAAKSPGRNGAIVAKHLKSLLEDGGSPIGYEERSLEVPAAANRMAEAVGGGRGKVFRVESGVVRRAKIWRAEVVLRVLEVALCLVSISVMAADKTSGWAGDYFDRYQEYRFVYGLGIGEIIL
ncbi:CASP-like protein 4A3 [Phalaenopsis equestris]|uniref:CASP-like protein 4A3 n=1 Tax=Phalaenopsis equestris TaxID=78828 RepID=UPI0009E3CB44|nr:CASP-like protein 4A3 [Phalaenopsis equestris]